MTQPLHFFIILSLLVSFSAGAADKGAGKAAAKAKAKSAAKEPEQTLDDPAEFRKKLGIMLSKTEKSIKLLREQIIQNQSAPFLPDLFLQLADLLSEKSNVLYYQRAEKEKTADLKLDTKQVLNPIVAAQQEAIAIYQQLLKEFPTFQKRDKVLYRLAIAQKSIDEGPAFIATSEVLLRDFPKTKESMQVRLLVGQFYFDQQDFKASSAALLPAQDCPFPFERNAARYRLGLIKMNDEKFADALAYFEKVATDDELNEGDNPLEVSIKTRTVNSNIKREALIDSIRAFTEIFKKNPDPVGYYNRIAPTEALFQEVIEKLAYRYIFLKNESQAMSLLRVLSERVADPQKVINIYQEVLLLFPPMERIEVPYQEMQYVLAKYNDWITFYDVPKKTKEESYKFFETQIREMGTKSHDLGKSELSTARKDILFERARNFYHLYLGFFNKGPEAVKIATNLADVYFYQKNFLKSGELYLRVYQGEFGPPSTKEALLQNAILCLQKPAPSDFYEIVRQRGLLVKAIQSYMTLDNKKKNDPKLNFILVKSAYEQGLYNTALPGLVSFIAKYPQASKEVESATDIGLDYFNIRSDFKGLVDWSQKVLAINNLPANIRTRLESVKAKALLKKVDEEVKGKANYDAFAQGKIYFETALSMQDDSMKSVVLEQALARSKAEKDINTFLSAAKALAAAEKKPDKRATILLGMGEQTLAIGRFYQTLEIWQQVFSDAQVPDPIKKQVKEKALRLVIMLKDWWRIQSMLRSSSSLSDTLRQSAQGQLGQYMESAIQDPGPVISSASFEGLSADDLNSYFKGQFKVVGGIQSQITSTIQKRCSAKPEGILCRWNLARSVPSRVEAFKALLQTAPVTLQSVEPVALKLNALFQEFKALEETGDPTLDIFWSLYKARAFQDFAQYLKKVGIANKQVAEILSTKASESMQNAKAEYSQCAKIILASSLLSPINRFCLANKEPTLQQALTWRKFVVDHGTKTDPKSPAIDALQKFIFVDPSKGVSFLELTENYWQTRNYRHAIAMASYGMSTFPQAKEDFAAILGCSLVEMGLFNEAAFQLKNASDFKNMKSQCLASLKSRTE